MVKSEQKKFYQIPDVNLTKVLSSYKLAKISNIERINEGVINQNYKISLVDGRQYVLKKYIKNVESVKYIHAVMRFMESKGVAIAEPILNLTSGYDYAVQNASVYALFPWVSGLSFAQVEDKNATHRSIAATMAQIHLAGKVDCLPKNLQPNFTFVFDLKYTIHEIQQILEKIEKDSIKSKFNDLAKMILNYRLKVIENFSDQEKVFLNEPGDTLIHGDLNTGNFIFEENGSALAVLDWDNARMELRGVELIKEIFIACPPDSPDFAHIAQIYVSAYNQIFPIPSAELDQALTRFWVSRITNIWMEKAHFLEGQTRSDKYLDSTARTLMYLGANRDKVLEVLVKALK